MLCRIRGYQTSQGAAPKKLNKAPFQPLNRNPHSGRPRSESLTTRTLNDQMNKEAESQETSLMESVDARDLEDLGFARLYEPDK